MPWPLSSSASRASERSRSRSRSAGEVPAMPALLTRTSSVPSSRSTSANMARTWPESATSAWMARSPERPGPSASTVARAALSSRSLATIVAPSAAKSVAMARPIPEPAPVMRATLPSSFTRVRPAAAPASAVEPGDHEAPAEVVADVGPEVLDVGLPRRDGADRGAVETEHVLRDVALDVVDDLAPLGHVEGAALEPDHLG